MLTRFHDWPERLATFLDSTRTAPFTWGTNDCALRACSAVEAMTGVDIAHELRGRYRTELGAARVMKRFAGNLEAVCEKVAFHFALREVPTSYAGRGDLLLLDSPAGPALGIVSMNGHQAEFTSPSGIKRVPVSVCRRAWRIG